MWISKKQLWIIGLLGAVMFLTSCSSGSVNYIQAPHNYFHYSVVKAGTIEIHEDDVQIHEFTGASMQPSIFTGNKAITIPYSGQELKEGQIVTYYGNNDAVERQRENRPPSPCPEPGRSGGNLGTITAC